MDFLCVERKIVPWCRRKVYSLLKEECVPSLVEKRKRSLINRLYYKEFDGYGPRVLLMGREKIEHEIEREKRVAALEEIVKKEKAKGCRLRENS